jgi:hypothetical protein
LRQGKDILKEKESIAKMERVKKGEDKLFEETKKHSPKNISVNAFTNLVQEFLKKRDIKNEEKQ